MSQEDFQMFFSTWMKQMMKKDHVHLPITYKKGRNIIEHVGKVEKFCKEMDFDDKNKFSTLLNSVEEDCQYEIFSLYDYTANLDNFGWLKIKMTDLFGNFRSTAESLRQLSEVIQQPHQSIRDYVADVRIKAYKLLGDNDIEWREKVMVKHLSTD